ncbi:CPXCG motif-containing cysteine-rich protein [Aphanothece sacrum]|uniref:CPXCG motif-containing cysteine-rich protein n=1 Tax=Aphanothece sacrum FPU1 TaxID=1920663 RepID=A0A401IIZ6_APHSA|nr:CPXCG motif-containing cysteine-rich protein [Aphanothece sacrum]GBF81282.1 hypothetical protein AsFPU1_2694 [Aphanothece sacrum FPU1]GBF83368.1 hypothetical protein AsFPU3_0410 [Aphanothece sacrum FPU3]
METTADYYCAYCGEVNTTFVDISAGSYQSYIEDCQICCRPNLLYISIDPDSLDISIESDYDQ